MGSAVIGVGLGGGAHLGALADLGVPIAGVLSATPDRTAAAAAAWRVRAYGDLDELLADDDVTAVHVCVPTTAHRRLVEAALRAGRAVLCEKPMAASADDATAMADLARQLGARARVAFNRRFDEGIQRLRRAIGDGELGAPINVWGAYEQAFNAEPTSVDWRFDPDLIGPTRVVSELGSHWLDLASYVMDADLVRVSSLLSDPPGPRQVDSPSGGEVVPPNEDAFAAFLEYDNGVTGSVYATELAHGAWDDIVLRIDGTKRSARWSSDRPNQLLIAHKREGTRLVGSPAPGHSIRSLVAEFSGRQRTEIAATFDDGVRNCAAIDAIAAGGRQRAGWRSVGVA